MLPWSRGAGRFRRRARRARLGGGRALRRRRLHRDPAPCAVALGGLRHRGQRRLRGVGGVGGRRGQDGGGLDRHALSSAAPGRPAPGPPGAHVAPAARVRRGLAGGPDRDRARPGHRLGPAAPHRGLHGPRRGDAGGPGLRAGLRGLRAGARVLEAAGRPRGRRRGRRSAPGQAQRVPRVELRRALARADDPRPISGAIVAGELNRLERQLFDADCAEANERLGRRPRLDELARTSAQRRADALVEMATRSAAARPRASAPPPSSASSSATRASGGASASSRTGPSSPPRPCCPGWTRPTSSGPSSLSGAGST